MFHASACMRTRASEFVKTILKKTCRLYLGGSLSQSGHLMAKRTTADAAKLTVLSTQISHDGLKLAGELTPEVFEGINDGHVTAEAPLKYDLRIFIVNQGILVRGSVSSVLRCSCDRCLNDFNLPIENECAHFIEPPLPPSVELTMNLREDILILMPQKCLCQPDCLGICPECGQNRNLAGCDCQTESSAPSPWSQLDELKL
ncbi:MAG: hypothetical protein ACI8W8_003216 [Rhodothermales bacterium]|jgi:uncharacterized protein